MLWLLGAVQPVVKIYPSSGLGSGAVIAAIVAGVAAPVVTGLFLWKNTGRTVTAERDRLTATLAAEDRRLQERLSFERGETDRDELRRILDRLAEHLLALHNLAGDANGEAVVLMIQWPDCDSHTINAIADLRLRVMEEIDKVGGETEHFRLRLGPEGAELTDLATSIRRRGQDVALATGRLRVGATMHTETSAQMDAHVDRIVAERAAMGEGRERFIDEARRFTEARLHSGTEKDDQAPARRVARGA